MTLHQTIRNDVKEALRLRDKDSLSALRTLLSEIANEVIAQGKDRSEDLPDEDVLRVIGRLAKQRRDSIEQFQKGGRDDLVRSEKAELSILERYLPEQMSEDDIRAFLEKKKSDLGLTDPSHVGALMAASMKELRGVADGKTVMRLAAELLSS